MEHPAIAERVAAPCASGDEDAGWEPLGGPAQQLLGVGRPAERRRVIDAEFGVGAALPVLLDSLDYMRFGVDQARRAWWKKFRAKRPRPCRTFAN